MAQSTASIPESHEHLLRVPPRLWKLLFAGGLAIWLFSATISEITGDTILVPTVIIVGSFLVPVTVTAFALSRKRGATSRSRRWCSASSPPGRSR